MEKLRWIPIIVSLFFSCSLPNEQEDKNNAGTVLSESQIEQLVLEKEKEALNSWAEGSILGYTKYFDEDVTYIDDIGAQERIDGLEAMRLYATRLDSMNMIPKHRYEMINPKVQLSKDVAILTYQYHPYRPDGTAGTKWKATSVYRSKQNDWKIIHAHWSMIKQQ
jgi:hypothetical protein